MIDEFIAEINAVRATLPKGEDVRKPIVVEQCLNRLTNTKHLSREPIVQCLIDDLRDFDSGSKLIRTKAHINEKRDRNICSLFSSSYFPTLGLDFLTYEPLQVNEQLAKRYPSMTTPVRIARMSTGFEAREVVAIFPENHLDGIQKQDDLIFYFIDKFVARHRRITRKLLENITVEDDFPVVHHVSDRQIEEAACHWVWLHEYYHRQGPLPVPKYLWMKSLKPLAGLEELRVDLSGMIACIEDSTLPRDLAELTWQFVLAERLLRYSVEGIPKPNYDAVGSQVLFNFLLENGGIYLERGCIRLSATLPGAIKLFLMKIDEIERLILIQDPLEVQRLLLDFVNRYAGFDPATGDYSHVDYFSDVKRRLEV
ncbi:DUF6421 family protein [Burkholderia ubonensis]|uniref:DUF6421 family protein n=1 Tax=Burkholderia ubonensis TaxID=101571 RepID=UPI000AD620D4|nr:DUF6421 family protein [Burkholderia ubonensis]